MSGSSRLVSALRSLPGRLLLMFVVLAALDLLCQWLAAALLPRVPASVRGGAWLAFALLLALVVIGAYRALVRLLERRSADELGATQALRRVALGVALGAGLFAAVYVILWALGALSLQGAGSTAGLARALAVSASAAVGEELVFRGVLFRLFEERLGTTLALALSALLFGLLHAGNRGATWVSTLAIALEAGTLLALAYVYARSLWLPIGVHFGWNFVEGGVFGAAVSGGKSTGLIVAPLSGPALLTGGAFGPEASLVAVAVALGGAALLGWRARVNGEWRARRARAA